MAETKPREFQVQALKDLQFHGRRVRAGEVFTLDDKRDYRPRQMLHVTAAAPALPPSAFGRLPALPPEGTSAVAVNDSAVPFAAAANLRTSEAITRERAAGLDAAIESYRGTRRWDGGARGGAEGPAAVGQAVRGDTLLE